MVEAIGASTFGPRVGHEMLSGVTTSHTPLWVADVHRASSLELLLTMSSDRQLVLTRHDLHQLLAKTDTRPDRAEPEVACRRPNPSRHHPGEAGCAAGGRRWRSAVSLVR
jgi:hypothetical protein